MNDQKPFIPYSLLSPGFEAVYTGKKSPVPIQEENWPVSRFTDEDGSLIERWSVWTWTPLHGESAWSDEIRLLNRMQADLGPLDDETRRIRAQIGSLVLCESGIPVTIDELLSAIGRGRLPDPAFHNGCWPCNLAWSWRGTQPGQAEAMQAITGSLNGYLAGESQEELARRFPQARMFLRRAFEWLGAVDNLSEVQKLMVSRLLLLFDFFTWRNRDYEAMERAYFAEGGQGRRLDAEISRKAGLPEIYPNYAREYAANLEQIQDPAKWDLYRVCGSIAHGLHGISDCHHSTFRWIESWIHGIGIGNLEIPERRPGTERERLARLLFGYTLALDKWLAGVSMQFLLLDLGYLDLGCDPKNEILRVYAYLGEERTPIKEWLAACLWYSLSGGGNPSGIVIHKGLLERAARFGIFTREWMENKLFDEG